MFAVNATPPAQPAQPVPPAPLAPALPATQALLIVQLLVNVSATYIL